MHGRPLSSLMALLLGGLPLLARPAYLAAGTVSTGLATGESQPLEIERSTVHLNPAQQTATFDLELNHAPDFYTLDSLGRPADSFQYYINPNWSGNVHDLELNYGQFRDVVRGDEIHTSGKLLIRDASIPADPQFNSGGWGPVIAAETFHVKGDNLTFTASYSDLRAPKGAFSYEVFTTHFGSTVNVVQSWAVPLPPAAWSGCAMLGSMAGVCGLRRLRRRQTLAAVRDR